jgi:phosphoribosylglycinamide formyltransferase-1
MGKKTRLGILISGSGTNMMSIAERCRKGEINAEVAFVGTDKPSCQGLAWAKKQGLLTTAVNFRMNKENPVKPDNFDLICQKLIAKNYPIPQDWYESGAKGKPVDPRNYYYWKVSCEQMLLQEMFKHKFDLLVLAGYMQVCTPYFIETVSERIGPWRIMNIHPALLPAFPGTDGYGDAWRYGVKVHGSTVHFIDTGIDTGPIIGQACYDVREDDTFEDFKQRGLEREYELCAHCIRLFTEGRLRVEENEAGRNEVRIANAESDPDDSLTEIFGFRP